MGSDLYMEQQNWRPRPDIVEWIDADHIRWQRDAFYDGYHIIYEGRMTPEVRQVLKGQGTKIPQAPNKMVKYRLDFTMESKAKQILTLNTTHYPTEKDAERALVAAAAENLGLSEREIRNRKVTIVEE